MNSGDYTYNQTEQAVYSCGTASGSSQVSGRYLITLNPAGMQ